MLVKAYKKTHINKEALIWTIGLIVLFFAYPFAGDHFSLCVYHHLGFDFCLGCGIGRSISSLMHGDISASWEFHKLGVFVLPLIVFRIVKLVNNQIKK